LQTGHLGPRPSAGDDAGHGGERCQRVEGKVTSKPPAKRGIGILSVEAAAKKKKRA
jgi:hypothetical protein